MMENWLLFEDTSVIDGLGNDPVRNLGVLVRSDKIYAVGKELTADAVRETTVPRGDRLRVIDGREKTVMPGLIDGHCHFTFGHPRSQEEMDLYTPMALRTLRSAWNLKRALRAGITSASQPGGSYYIGVGIRDAINEGIVEGPRIFTAGRQISTSNGIGDYYPDTVGVPDGSVGILANTPDEMKAVVRKEIKNGVDFIKLADSPFGEFQAFTDDELKMVTDLAHQMKTPVAIHARGNDETKAAIRAGVDWIMHSNVMDDEAVAALAESRIPLIPALSLLANWADFGHLVGVPAGLRDACAAMVEQSADSYTRAYKAGVRFGMGAESGFAITPLGEWHAREIELLAKYSGMSNVEAIQTATSNAALTVGLADHVGAVLPGMLADLLMIDGDPAADLTILQDRNRIEMVVKDGKVVDFSDEDRYVLRPYEPSQIFQHDVLLYSTVYGDGATNSRRLDSLPWEREDAHDLARDIHKREVIAARESSSPGAGQ
jgi:imidazolonepropionase-like amidohydrolase